MPKGDIIPISPEETPENFKTLEIPSSVDSALYPKEIKIELDTEETVRNKDKIRTSLIPLMRIDNKIVANNEKVRLSYDSAILDSDIELINLKALCHSFAYAIRQHILFARGKKTFFELRNQGNTRFSYKLGKLLNIELPNERIPVSMKSSKKILLESLNCITGTQVSIEAPKSYLGEKDTDDLDLTRNESYIEEIVGHVKVFRRNKSEISKAFVKIFRNSLVSINSSKNVLKKTRNRLSRLMKSHSHKKIDIHGLADISKLIEVYKKNEAVPESHNEYDLESEETIDLESVDLTERDTALKSIKRLDSNIKSKELASEQITKDESKILKEFSVFQVNYDFATQQFVELSKVAKDYLEIPTEEEIYKFCKKILVYSKMEKEMPIIALIYIEKLMIRSRLLMNELNWRRFVFIALVIGSKVRC